MCDKCLDAAKRYYPALSEDEVALLVWNATCFPFGPPEMVEDNLKELVANTDGTLAGAMKYACDQLDNAMKEAPR